MADSRFVPLPRSTGPLNAVGPVDLASFERGLAHTAANLRGYIILNDGAVTAEKYFEPYAAEDKVFVYSVSKSFASTAVGLAVAEGLLSLDDRLVDIFPDQAPAEIDEHLAELRVRHALSMSTGHAVDTALPLFKDGGDDWERAFLSMPLQYAPGTHFCYNSGASYMLASAVERVTGQGLVEYLTPRLFEPLGFDAVAWDRNPNGAAMGGWGFMLRMEDLAKLGELYRNEGEWNGVQILDPEWVRLATSVQSDNDQDPNAGLDWRVGYGFQFWMCQHGAFRADGAFGQLCVVFPEQRAVITLLGEIQEIREVLDVVWAELLPVLNRPAVEPVPAQRYTIDDSEALTFEINPEGVLTLTYSTPDGDAALRAGPSSWVAGRSDWPFGDPLALPSFGTPAQPTLISARYRRTAVDTYELEWVWRETPHRNTGVIVVGQDELTFTIPQRFHSLELGSRELTLRGTA